MQLSKSIWFQSFFFLALYVLFIGVAYAGGEALPWDAPIDTIAKALTGKVALGISTIAMAAAGLAMVFGGEMSDLTRRLVMIVLAVSLVVFGGGMLGQLFKFSGALI